MCWVPILQSESMEVLCAIHLLQHLFHLEHPEGTQDVYSDLENVTQDLRRTVLFWKDIRATLGQLGCTGYLYMSNHIELTSSQWRSGDLSAHQSGP